jgi:outer membrane protein TolC
VLHPPVCGLAAALAIALAGCASYQPKSLGPVQDSPAGPADIRVDPHSLPFAALATHRFDPSDGLDEIEVATLAVVNNPDLKLVRDDAAIAHAQALSAGLLPDPQLAASADTSNTDGPGSTRAFSLGLSYDINALIQHASVAGAARAEARKTDLTLLWQEWQVISQARLLFVKLVYGQRLLAVLEENRALFADRVERTRAAQQKGLLASDAVLPNVAALQDVEKQLFDQRRQQAQNARDLNLLLGLQASAVVPLQRTSDAAVGDAPLSAALADVELRRPDLLALRAGYEAQDERYRGAVLAQFPALNVGLTRSRDNSNVYSKSIGVTLSLPLLNRNRGNIAIEKATREKLFDEYQQRVRATRGEIQGLLKQRQLDQAQLEHVNAAVSRLSAALARSELAFRSNNIDLLAYANVRATLLARQVEQINLEQQLAEQRVGLQTLLGVDPHPEFSSGQSSK